MTQISPKYLRSRLAMRKFRTAGLALAVLLLIFWVQPFAADDPAPPAPNADSLKTAPDSLFQQGTLLYEQGKIAEAVLLWEKVYGENHDYPGVRQDLFEAYKFLGIEKYNQNLQEEAIAVWKKAEKLNPGDEEIKNYIKRSKNEIVKLEELYPKLNLDDEADSLEKKQPSLPDKSASGKSAKKDTKKEPSDDKLTRQLKKLSDSLGVLADNIRRLAVEKTATKPDSAGQPTLFGFIDGVEYNDHLLNEATFKIDEVELDLKGGLSGHTSFRTDLDFTTDSLDEVRADIEQGFMDWRPGSNERWLLVFGKFNAPFGRVAVDAPSRYLYSPPLVYTYGRPENILGLMITCEFSPVVDWSLYLVNGWDVNNDNNRDKTVGTRLLVNTGGVLSGGFSVISGPEQDDNNRSRRSVFAIDLEMHPVRGWLLAGEFNYGLETKALTNDAQADWSGLMLLGRIDFSRRGGLAARFDFFDDHDGLRTGYVQQLKALSLSPSLALSENMTARFEGRYEFSDRKVFLDDDDDSHDYRLTSLFELFYRF